MKRPVLFILSSGVLIAAAVYFYVSPMKPTAPVKVMPPTPLFLETYPRL